MASLPPKPNVSSFNGATGTSVSNFAPSHAPIKFVERRNTKAPILFVNHIPQDMSDSLLIKILDCCGSLVAWRRIRDKVTSTPPPSATTPQAPTISVTMKPWGFVEYETWDGVLTALRILGGMGNAEALGLMTDRWQWIAPNGKRFSLSFKADNKVAGMIEQDNAEKLTPEDVARDKRVLEKIMNLAIKEHPETAEKYKEPPEEEEEVSEEVGPTEELLKREVARFRDKTAFKDKKKPLGDDEQKLKMEEARQRDRHRLQALAALADPGTSLYKEDGPWSETDDDNDKEKAMKKRERKALDKLKDYEDRIKWWETKESRRIGRYRDMESRQRADERRKRDEEETLRRFLDEYDDDLEASSRRGEYYRDPERYWSRRRRIREREQQADAEIIQQAIEAGDLDTKDEREEQELWSRLDQALVDKYGTIKFDNKRKTEEDHPGIKRRKVGMSTDERKDVLQDVIDSIPTEEDELFSWPIQWNYLDETMLESKFKPFVTQRIVEYLGEEDTDMIEFIVHMLRQQMDAKQVEGELKEVLDEEANNLVQYLWKTLILETESKARGL